MTKLCICDIDGVISNSDARFAKAEEARQAFMKDLDARLETILHGATSEKRATDLYWRTAFDPELVALDIAIPGAIDALAALAFSGWQVVILTSRPESMRVATRQWLFESGYPVESLVIMKVPAFQYTKTVVWKAGMVQTLAAMFGAEEVVVVDDEMDSFIENLHTGGFEDSVKLRCFTSLQEAMEAL